MLLLLPHSCANQRGEFAGQWCFCCLLAVSFITEFTRKPGVLFLLLAMTIREEFAREQACFSYGLIAVPIRERSFLKSRHAPFTTSLLEREVC